MIRQILRTKKSNGKISKKPVGNIWLDKYYKPKKLKHFLKKTRCVYAFIHNTKNILTISSKKKRTYGYFSINFVLNFIIRLQEQPELNQEISFTPKFL